jgi:hypothetical protein
MDLPRSAIRQFRRPWVKAVRIGADDGWSMTPLTASSAALAHALMHGAGCPLHSRIPADSVTPDRSSNPGRLPAQAEPNGWQGPREENRTHV